MSIQLGLGYTYNNTFKLLITVIYYLTPWIQHLMLTGVIAEHGFGWVKMYPKMK
jgi:hypothetical protein